MIVKYFKDGVWGYIDNVRQAANMDIEPFELIKKYDDEVKAGTRADMASYIDFTNNGTAIIEKGGEELVYQRLPEDIIAVNKVFIMATENIPEEIRENGYHTENLLDTQLHINNVPANVIMLYLNDHKEYETLILVTNQKCFLMNDKGQTIERLV